MRRSFRSDGFSLIEMMVAVAVMGVITAQLFVVFGNQKKVYASNERALDVQEQARLTLDLLSFDTRMAGFMVPRWTAVGLAAPEARAGRVGLLAAATSKNASSSSASSASNRMRQCWPSLGGCSRSRLRRRLPRTTRRSQPIAAQSSSVLPPGSRRCGLMPKQPA